MPWWWGYTEPVSPRPPRLHRISTIFDRVIELSLRVDVRFDPESDQHRAAPQYVAKGHLRTCENRQLLAAKRTFILGLEVA
jgi:hypothetical protein